MQRYAHAHESSKWTMGRWYHTKLLPWSLLISRRVVGLRSSNSHGILWWKGYTYPKDFRKLKETNWFDSDNITMQYLLERHNLIEDQSLATIGCSTSPAGTRIGSESQPVCHSTPLSTPRAHIEHRRLPRASLRERLVDNMKYDCSWSLHYWLQYNSIGVEDSHHDDNYNQFVVDTDIHSDVLT